MVQLLPRIALLPGPTQLDASENQISRHKSLEMARIGDAPIKRTSHAWLSGPCDHVPSPYALRTVPLASRVQLDGQERIDAKVTPPCVLLTNLSRNGTSFSPSVQHNNHQAASSAYAPLSSAHLVRCLLFPTCCRYLQLCPMRRTVHRLF